MSRPPIDAGALEQSLELVRSHAAGSKAGVFGPNSEIWRIDREAAAFLGAGRALLMQLAHPWVATAIAQHSTALGDPIGRFHRTFQISRSSSAHSISADGAEPLVVRLGGA